MSCLAFAAPPSRRDLDDHRDLGPLLLSLDSCSLASVEARSSKVPEEDST